MAVNLEIKGLLARLLATEDLIIEHKKVDTASFNVDTRCLVLPMWERATDSVYTLLVLHEISHAKYSPNMDWMETHKIPHQYVNITEDARVEKLCKREYPGSPKSYYTGYKELHEQDFFCLEGEDVEEMNLADRANLYFKIGHFLNISFTEEEQDIIDLIADAETFDEALNSAKVLYEYCKTEECENKLDDMPNTQGMTLEYSQSHQSSDSAQSQNNNDGEEQDSNQQNGEVATSQTEPQRSENSQPSSNQTTNSTEPGTKASENTEPEVKTVDSLKKSIENLIDQHNTQESTYLELPVLNLDSVIIKNKEIHEYMDTGFNLQLQKFSHSQLFSKYDQDYMSFKTSAQAEVNYLVKEFECRKAAQSYARAATSTTGTLDCSRLHTYKYNDDLFKKVTTFSDGKNHGLIFILDWSGSMSDVMLDTMKQLYNLIWFCKKVSIPFEVYAFSNNWHGVEYDSNGAAIFPKQHHERKPGFVLVDESFSLLNLFTSKVNNRVLEVQMKNIWRLTNTLKNQYGQTLSCPRKLGLSGTPLNETLVAMHQILPKFEKENKLEKVHCVILTDGDASGLPVLVERKYNTTSETYLGAHHINLANAYLRDRKIGRTYKFSCSQYKFANTLLNNLKDKFPKVSFIGMRILSSREVTNFVDKHCDSKEWAGILEEWKKNKSFSIKTSGYDSYFGLSSTALSNDSEFEVAEEATKSQIKNAFMKSLRSKKLNKKVLKEFAELIS
jgi:hypothetical protein